MTRTLDLIVAGVYMGRMEIDMYDGTKPRGVTLPTLLTANLSVDEARKLSDMIKPEEKL